MSLFRVIIAALFVCWWPLSAHSGDDDDRYPPTAIEKIGDQIGDLVVSVQGIATDVAVGKQEMKAIGESIREDRKRSEKLWDRSGEIEKRVIVVEISSNANTSEILSMKTKFLSFISVLIGVIGAAVAAYIKSKATERNTAQVKRIADTKKNLNR